MNRPELETTEEQLRQELRHMPAPPPPPDLLARLHADIPEELPRVALPILDERLRRDDPPRTESPLVDPPAPDNVVAGPWYRNRTMWAAASIVLTVSAGLWMWRLAEKGQLETLPQTSVPAAQEAASPMAPEMTRGSLPQESTLESRLRTRQASMASADQIEAANAESVDKQRVSAESPVAESADDIRLDAPASGPVEKDQEAEPFVDEDVAEQSFLGHLASEELAREELASEEIASEETASERFDAGQVGSILAPPAPVSPPTAPAPSAKVMELEEVRAGVLEVAETSPEDRRSTPENPVRLEEPDTAKRERSSASGRDGMRRLDEGFASEPSATAGTTREAERAPRRPTSRIQGHYGTRATRPPLLGIRAALDAGTWPVEAWLEDLVVTVCAGVERSARVELEGITWDLVDLLRAGRQGSATLEQVDALDARLGAWIEQQKPSAPHSTAVQVRSWLPKIRALIEAPATSP